MTLINARADVIIGQRNAYEMVSYSPMTGDRVNNPIGVAIDISASPPLMYVFEGLNNRISVFAWSSANWNTTTGARTGTPAPTYIHGQPDAVSCATNNDSNFTTWPNSPDAGAGTLAGIINWTQSPNESAGGCQPAFAPNGDVWCGDPYNHRLLRYARGSATAAQVIGQADFTGHLANRGGSCAANTLNTGWGDGNVYGQGCVVDPVAGHVWFSDTRNHRVLRFPRSPGGLVSGTADIVLGQPNFTTNTPGTALNKLYSPGGIALSADRKTLYVCDSMQVSGGGSARVVKYTSATAGFTTADIGATGATFGSGWSKPMFVAMDATNYANKVWVYDAILHNIYLLNESDGSEVANTRIGNSDGNIMSDSFGLGFSAGGDVFFTSARGDHADNVMFVKASDIGNATPGTRNAPVKLFQSNVLASDNYHVTGTGLKNAVSVAVTNYSGGRQMVVSDIGRVMFWGDGASPLSLTTGMEATGGLTHLTSVSSTSSRTVRDSQFSDASVLAADANGTYLWFASPQNICAFTLPLHDGDAPSVRITGLQNYLGDGGGAGTVNVMNTWGIAVNADSTELWVAQPGKNRCLRIRNPRTAPVVDCILGQANTTDVLPNRSASGDPATIRAAAGKNTFYLPGSLGMDPDGNLFVSDHALEIQGNYRLLMFNAATIPSGNGSMIYGPDADKVFAAAWQGTGTVASWQPAFDPVTGAMVVGYNHYLDANPLIAGGDLGRDVGMFWGVYLTPTGAETSPDGLGGDWGTHFNSTFDALGNLYVVDHNRARVLVYNVGATPSASVSPSISPSASLSPSASKSPSASASLSPSASYSPSASASVSPSSSYSPSASVSPSAPPVPVTSGKGRRTRPKYDHILASRYTGAGMFTREMINIQANLDRGTRQ